MSDPFAPSSDPDIPTPTRSDLLPLVHGSVRDQLAAGALDAKHAENEWMGARRQWDEGHKRDAAARRAQSEREPPALPEAQDATSSTPEGLESFLVSIKEAQESDTPPQPPESDSISISDDPTAQTREKQAPKNIIHIDADGPPPADPMAEYLEAERKRQSEAASRIRPLPPRPVQSHDIERAVDRALRKAKDRADVQRGLDEFTKHLGFSPLAEQATPIQEKTSWFHRIPVWKEFGHWLKWASAAFVFALGMTQVNEYAWAMAGLVVCGLCCLAQIYVWTASPNRFRNGIVKALLAVLSLTIIGISGLTVVKIKGDKPWSNLFAKNEVRIPSNAYPVVEITVSTTKQFQIENKGLVNLVEIDLTETEYKFQKNAWDEKRLEIEMANRPSMPFLHIDKIAAGQKSEMIDLGKMPFFDFVEFADVTQSSDEVFYEALRRNFSIRITFRDERNGDRYVTYRVTGSVRHAPGLFENLSQTSRGGPPKRVFQEDIPLVIITQERELFKGDAAKELLPVRYQWSN